MENQPLTNQKLFEIVWERSKDKRRALKSPTTSACSYRSHDGLKCFIGAAMPDKIYSKRMDGMLGNSGLGFRELVSHFPIAQGYFINIREDFATELQRCHDSIPPDEWEKELLHLATDYELTVPE